MSQESKLLEVNFAASALTSLSLGPGVRSILWVRGCERRCSGCIAPQWWSKEPDVLIDTHKLAKKLLIQNPDARGITISGGEPFLQAAALSQMLRYTRQFRDFDSIVYSGYTLEQLKQLKLPGVPELLAEVDILIDGVYKKDIPANDGIRGSLNQVIHFLGDRISSRDFFAERNPLEIHAQNGSAFMIGVPSNEQLSVFNHSVNLLINQLQDGFQLYPKGKKVSNEC